MYTNRNKGFAFFTPVVLILVVVMLFALILPAITKDNKQDAQEEPKPAVTEIIETQTEPNETEK